MGYWKDQLIEQQEADQRRRLGIPPDAECLYFNCPTCLHAGVVAYRHGAGDQQEYHCPTCLHLVGTLDDDQCIVEIQPVYEIEDRD